ncbi:hypothetical protein MASR1M42_03710 [Azonexus hydrophilus]
MAAVADLPGARAGEAGNAEELFDFRDEFTAGQVLFDQPAGIDGQVGELVDPGDFAAVLTDQRQPFFRGGNGEGADRGDAAVLLAVLGVQDKAAVGVALECEVHAHFLRCQSF